MSQTPTPKTDGRLWAKIDLGYLSNPKMSDVIDESPTAPLMHLASILHSAQHLTDGHVSPRAMMRSAGGSRDDIEILIDAGLWHAPGHECDQCPQPEDGRIYVHNYLDHNISSNQVEAASNRGRKAAHARWNKPKDANRNANRMQSASNNDADRMQSASENNAERNAERNAKRNARLDQIRLDISPLESDDSRPAIDQPSNTPSDDEMFDSWYQNYPRKEGKGAARKAFAAALKKVDLDTLIQGLDRYNQKLKSENTEKRYIAMPSTWLNQERWDDETITTGAQDQWSKIMNWTPQN